MALVAIEAYLLFAVALFITALYVKDYILGFFSGSFLVFGGLNIILHGFDNFVQPYQMIFGIMIIIFGVYVMIRSIMDNLETY